MDERDDIIKHFRNCKYLWKCKYCGIEYDNEPEVEKHHCQTTSPSNSEDEGDDNNDNNDQKHRKIKKDDRRDDFNQVR